MALVRFIAVMAAFALLLTGAPVASAAAPCEPCTADCMTQAAVSETSQPCDHHDQVPAQPDNGKACKPGMVCQASVAAIPHQQPVAFTVTVTAAPRQRALERSLASHPPDQALRPPISL